MAKKHKITPIELSTTSYSAWYDKLRDFFIAKGMTETEAIEKVKSILSDAQKGWPHAPRNIDTRIKIKSGYNWKPHNNLAPNADSIPSVIRRDEKIENTIKDMYQWEQSLTEKEMAWWNNRQKEYESEFEFNKSSDKPLLFQLLVEELTQRRIAALILKSPEQADSYSKLMTESLKRLQDTQTKLGITREQRADIIENQSGDVASLSSDLDEKIKRAKDKIEEWKKDESRQKFKKEQHPPINILPPIGKIEALLGIDADGNIGENIDTQDMADLVEEAAHIHDETLEDIEEEKKPSIREHGNEDQRPSDKERTD